MRRDILLVLSFLYNQAYTIFSKIKLLDILFIFSFTIFFSLFVSHLSCSIPLSTHLSIIPQPRPKPIPCRPLTPPVAPPLNPSRNPAEKKRGAAPQTPTAASTRPGLVVVFFSHPQFPRLDIIITHLATVNSSSIISTNSKTMRATLLAAAFAGAATAFEYNLLLGSIIEQHHAAQVAAGTEAQDEGCANLLIQAMESIPTPAPDFIDALSAGQIDGQCPMTAPVRLQSEIDSFSKDINSWASNIMSTLHKSKECGFTQSEVPTPTTDCPVQYVEETAVPKAEDAEDTTTDDKTEEAVEDETEEKTEDKVEKDEL